MSDSTPEASPKKANALFPIYSYEWKKVLPLFIMLFCVCFNYSILRNAKDALVVTAKGSGANVIPFIKVWVMLPMAIGITWFYAKLSNRLRFEAVFYTLNAIFLGYYALFGFVLYPNHEALTLVALPAQMEAFLPTGLGGLASMLRHWDYTLFYVMSELWAASILNVLLWGFVNEITGIGEAKRYYGFLNVACNLAAVAAGQAAIFFTMENFSVTFNSLITLVLISGAVTNLTFYWTNRRVLTDSRLFSAEARGKSKKKKPKMSLAESFKEIRGSKYLICIAILVVSYNLCINLAEVLWKDLVGNVYSDPNTYNLFLNRITLSMGIVSAVAAIFIPLMMKKRGWTFVALLTPIILVSTAAGFFFFFFAAEGLSKTWVFAVLGTSPLMISILLGAACNVFSKAAKYSVFDSSKEMAFIPLPEKMRLRGKAAIDGIGSRLGKSGGSIFQQGLLLFFGTLTMAAPFIAGFLALIAALWMGSCVTLGKLFKGLTNEEGESSKAAESTIPVEDEEVAALSAASSKTLSSGEKAAYGIG